MDKFCPPVVDVMLIRRAFLFVLLFVGLCPRYLLAQEAPISSEERSIVETMLDEVKSDIKGSYYDPKYHGVDLDPRFKDAKEHIKNAKTYNQAIASVAWALRPLNDSHTFLVPPRRTSKMIYGYQIAMVGDGCYVMAVEPGTDAEKKGLKVGDRILSLNRVNLNRDNLWEVNYLFRVLRPQAADELVLRGSDSIEHTLVINPKVTTERYNITVGIDYGDMIRESESYWHTMRRRSHTLGESLIIWSLPTFVVNEKAIDEMMGQSNKYPAMILDLRGDGGGSVEALLRRNWKCRGS